MRVNLLKRYKILNQNEFMIEDTILNKVYDKPKSHVPIVVM